MNMKSSRSVISQMKIPRAVTQQPLPGWCCQGSFGEDPLLPLSSDPPGQTKSLEHRQGPRRELHPSTSSAEEAKREGGPSLARAGRTQPGLPPSGRAPSAVASLLLPARFLAPAQLPVRLQTSPLPLACAPTPTRGTKEQRKAPGLAPSVHSFKLFLH